MRILSSRYLPPVFAAALSFAVVAQAQNNGPRPEQIRIAFVGDSMADGLWQGVTRHIAKNACLKALIDTERFGKNGTGLTRLDKFNWPREVLGISNSYRPQLYIISVGLNDRNPIRDPDGKGAQIYSKEWPEVYSEKIAKMLKSTSDMKANVLWLGIPALRDAKADQEAREKNALYAAVIEKKNDPSIRYVEPWRIKPAPEEMFSTYGPDEKGMLIALRTSDGSHFTPAGYDIVGAYLYPKIVESLRQRGVDLDKLCPATVDTNPGSKSELKSN
jgi:hypothetical protein